MVACSAIFIAANAINRDKVANAYSAMPMQLIDYPVQLLGIQSTPATDASTATHEYITTQPEGELRSYIRKGGVAYAYLGGIAESSMNGMTLSVVFAPDNETVWFKEIVAAADGTFGWVKGSISDGKVIIKPGQYVWYYDFGSYYTAYTLKRIQPNDNSESEYDKYVALEDDIVYTLGEDGSLTLDPDATGFKGIGLVRESTDQFIIDSGLNGKWLGYGDFNAVYNPFSPNYCQGPAEGVEIKPYSMTHKDYDGSYFGHLVNVAIDGNTIYTQGVFSNLLPEAWIAGTIEDGKAKFKSGQSAGVAKRHYMTYMNASHYIENEPESGIDYIYFTALDEIDFDFDSSNGIFSSSDDIILSASPYEIAPAEYYFEPKFIPFNDIAAKPATPVIGKTYQPWDEWYYYGTVSIEIPVFDVNGNFIDPSKLYYEFYIDNELVVFGPDNYYTETEMSRLPFSYDDGYYITHTGSSTISMAFLEDGHTSFGVRSIYLGGGTETASDFSVFSTSDLKTIEADSVNNITFFDLQGRQVSNPTNGLFIEKITMTDGSVKTRKVFKK